MSAPIGYDEVLRRLREAEDVVQALLSSQADAVITSNGVQLLRLHETDRALNLAKAALERLLEERTRGLLEANEKLRLEIAERQRAETALAASESKFRTLVESASEAVVAVDESGRIVLVNASTERMFQYPRQELHGQDLDSLVPGVLAEIESSRLTHRSDYPCVEVTGHRKDGSSFPVEASLSLADANGEHLALALMTDITERKRIEENLRETQKLESVGLLAGGVAHDFNNLLTAILGNASLLLDEVPARVEPQLRALIAGAEKAALVTRQLLAYAGKGQFDITDIDLSALVRENVDLIRVSIPKRIDMRLDLQYGPPPVHADAGQIQQVLMNLVINASEAIGEKAGTIGIATGEETTPDGRYVRLTVSDTGCGMNDDTKARIFDPFFTTKVYGRGLGLSAVLGILRTCSASIGIQSEPGKGTTFKILFPAGEAVSRSAGIHKEGADPRPHAKVLVVDDEDGVRAFACAALRRVGYTVIEAPHGQAAVDCVRSNRDVDLLLLDVTMPVMGGREALEQIRTLHPAIAVMVTSGYGSEEARRLMASAAKGTGFIQKPFTAQQLVRCIDSALKSKH